MRTTKTTGCSSHANSKSTIRSSSINPGAKTLKGVSDQKLLSSIRKLSEKERVTVLSILVHLIEIDRRRLYLEMGYSSLYEFCIKHLGYCEATATRRVRVSRCTGRFPLAWRALSSGKVTLSNLSLITKLMTPENASDLLSRITGRSKKEVELLVSSRNPGAAIRDTVRTVLVRAVLEVPVSGNAEVPDSGDGKESTITGDGKNSATLKGVTSERLVVLEERYEVKFGADQEFVEKMERLRSLLSTKYHRHLEFAELFSIVMDEYIERRSPEGRLKRKEKREQRKVENEARKACGASRTDRTDKSTAVASKKQKRVSRPVTGEPQNTEASRYIPRKVRDEVYARDKGRCAYVSPGGRKCGSKWDLQIDHIIPFARGGDNSPENLRLLCGKHNRLEAERAYGKKHMERYVKEHAEKYAEPPRNLKPSIVRETLESSDAFYSWNRTKRHICGTATTMSWISFSSAPT